jgi:hypothetical protein
MDEAQRPEANHHHRDGGPRRPASHLFTIRLWREEVEGGFEYRGSVRDVSCGAFRAFRRWADLTEFLVAQVEEAEGAPTEGGRDV